MGDIFQLKKENRNLKVLLSIGGWTYSPSFIPAAATEEGRQLFASSAVKLMADWGFDGLDVDWEFPKDEVQANNYVLLLEACRKELDEYAEGNGLDYHFEITIATSAGPDTYGIMDLEGMDPFVDAWHLMAYDYALSTEPTSGHQAALFADKTDSEATKFNTAEAVAGYLARGIPAHKIALGIPLYGRSFMATEPGAPSLGTGGGSLEPGVWLYKDLPQPGAEEHWDESIGATWSSCASTGEFVTYDNVESTKYKVGWLVKKGLGGAMFWEASGDKKGKGSLVGTVARALPGLDETPNWLNYPDSAYANIRGGNGGGCGGYSGPSTGFADSYSSTSPSSSPASSYSTPSSSSPSSSNFALPSSSASSSNNTLSSNPPAPSYSTPPSYPTTICTSVAHGEP